MIYKNRLFYAAVLISAIAGAADASEIHVQQLNDGVSVRNLSPDSPVGGVFVHQIPPGTVPPRAAARRAGGQRAAPVARIFLQTAGPAAISAPAEAVTQTPAISPYKSARPALPSIGAGAGVIISGSKSQQALPSVGKGAVLL